MRKGQKSSKPPSLKQKIQRDKFVYLGVITGINTRIRQLQRMTYVPDEWRMILTPTETTLTHLLLKIRKEGLHD